MDLTNRKQRGNIFKKYDGHCFYCGKELDPFGDWHIDHANPRSKGGADEEDNLRLACHACNIIKSDRTIEEYRSYLVDRYAEKMTNSIPATKQIFTAFDFPNDFCVRWFTMLYVILDRMNPARLKFYGEGGTFYKEPQSDHSQTTFDVDAAAEQLKIEFGFDDE